MPWIDHRYGFAFLDANGQKPIVDVTRVCSSDDKKRRWACVRLKCMDGTTVEIVTTPRTTTVRQFKATGK